MVFIWGEKLMANKHDPRPPEMQLYDSFITLYKNKGYGRFLEIFNLAGQSLSKQVRSALFSHVRTLYKNDLNFKKWDEQSKEEEIDTELRKEGAGVGTVATTDSGGLGFTPTFGGNGGPKRKKKETTITELKEFLMLSKAEEHEYPMKEKEDKRSSDPPMVVEFPSEIDHTTVDAERDFIMEVRQIQDHEKKDRRSRESAMSDGVDPMADVSRIQKTKKNLVLQKADDLKDLGHEDALFKALHQILQEESKNEDDV